MPDRLIWTYWENPLGTQAPPPHVQLCRETLTQNTPSCKVMLVTPQNVREFLPNLHDNIDRIALETTPDVPCLAIKCAFIRALLIEKYGGFYIDADDIVLRDLGPAFAILEHKEFACMRRTSRGKNHVSIGFYGARPGTRVISEYASALQTHLEAHNLYRWGQVGAYLVTPIVERFADTVHLFSEAEVQPITAERQAEFADKSEERLADISEKAMVVSLYHRMFDPKGAFFGHDRHDLVSGDSLLSRCFRLALDRGTY